MSLSNELRAVINLANAQKSTGPKTPEGKQRSSMNAFKHNLTGQSLMLQPNELEAYRRLTDGLNSDFKPKTELERQIVQKIIDTNFRLNRIAAIENNILNFGLLASETQTNHDDRTEAMAAQTRAWIERSNSLDVLGRYETRLTRQLLQFTRELERLQSDRRNREIHESLLLNIEKKRDNPDMASFGKTIAELVMSANSAGIPSDFPAGPAPNGQADLLDQALSPAPFRP